MSAPGVDKNVVEELIRGIQRALLVSDVNVELVMKLSEKIRERALTEKVPPGISKKDQMIKIVYEELVALLGEKPQKIAIDKSKQYVIMVVGIQGHGKTTTVAKLANYLKKLGYSVGVVCADTFRTGAYEQLKQLLEGKNIPVYGLPGEKDAVAIALKGVEYISKEQKCNVILIDTAGRHKDQQSLMLEMKALEEKIKPNEIMLVLDGTIGQQAGVHAEAFHKATPIGSIIVTKMDTSAKGGGALSAVAATGAKIKFIGTGEGLEDIEVFNPQGFIGRLLGIGDIEGLLERIRIAELEFSEERLKSFTSGTFTLEDFVRQLKEMRKLGPLKKILSKLPLPGIPNIPEEELDKVETQIDKWSAIILSMTPEERRNPHIIDSSRIRRIARGSGVTERDVKNLLQQYNLSKRMMKAMKRTPWKLPKHIPAKELEG
ncbi:MAG: signal recognition particle protein [Candidatus Terraquivivens tikiterensis]|uniref:Signal recognition particle 54 kDa protein n=1 Tax=Candidatus Terraquivivens tikiterensis TaxID=1980982 RepID=A0A2R7Y3X7_9ARCH|nr:MAG: signal recognition particle protein [Candidatus Terraquivivens tikiterensis]